MPDDVPRKGPDYDDDFYAWTQHQAAVVREMPVTDNRFDRDNVAEEIETLGRSERDAVRSQVHRIIEHFLKLQFSPATQPRSGWMRSINDARRILADLYEDARYQSELSLEEYDKVEATKLCPEECPYTLDQILQKRWYPEP